MEFFLIGEEELFIGFNLIGIQGMAVVTREEALEAFRSAVSIPDLKVLILSEEVASMLETEVMTWNLTGNYPLLVEIPGLHGRIPGKKTLVDSIREAIGINV